MDTPLPDVPWQLTGNHWIALPCIHPADASLHAVGILHRGARSAIEFAGSADFVAGRGAPLLRPEFTIDGRPHDHTAGGLAWESALGWIPTFVAAGDTLVVRGTLFAPYGRDADLAGAVVAFALENRSPAAVEVSIGLRGLLGHRQLRVRTPRPAVDPHVVRRSGQTAILEGAALPSLAALAVAGDEGSSLDVDGDGFVIRQIVRLEPGARNQLAFYLAVGPEGDGAEATLGALRRRGWRNLLASTRDAIQAMEQATGDASVDRMINRNLLFAYFYGVARAVDDAQYYMVRTRVPWHDRGTTVREWEALSWLIPAVQLADPPLARELILRACELHGYAPGQGVRYLDGSMFEPGFSLDGAAGYAIAIERYIRETGDDRIIDEPVVGDTLYVSHDDIAARRHKRYPLYATDVTATGSPAPHPYTVHANAAAAMALDVFRRTLDEETAREVADPAAVRAAIRRHLTVDAPGGRRFATAGDLEGNTTTGEDASGSALWLPVLETVERSDSDYRRTVKGLSGDDTLAYHCARLFGPDSAAVLQWLRATALHEGIAAERVSPDGRATANGGDAAVAGLLAWSVWYSIHAIGGK
jgi:hypothetical protein